MMGEKSKPSPESVHNGLEHPKQLFWPVTAVRTHTHPTHTPEVVVKHLLTDYIQDQHLYLCIQKFCRQCLLFTQDVLTESGWQPKTINVPCLQSAMIKPPVLLGQGLQLVRQSSHLNTREITPFNQGEKIVTVSFIKLTEQMVAYNFLLLKIFYKKNKLHTCFTLIPSGFKHIFLLTTLKQNQLIPQTVHTHSEAYINTTP